MDSGHWGTGGVEPVSDSEHVLVLTDSEGDSGPSEDIRNDTFYICADCGDETNQTPICRPCAKARFAALQEQK